MHHLHPQTFSIGRSDRERLAGHPGRVMWFTGLSGAGKSFIANALEVELYRRGRRTFILDGDNIRRGLNKDLAFTEEGRVENIRRVAEVAKLMMDAGIIVITAFISPFKRERELARELIGAACFTEVFIDTPLALCESRDPKGLYKLARSGQLQNMTGIDSPYEPPEHPDFTVHGELATVEASVKSLCQILAEAGVGVPQPLSGERPRQSPGTRS